MIKSKTYKAANVVFNTINNTAWSYDWWCFVKVIDNKLIFNNYRYSNTTTKHQYKVRSLLNELGIKIDRVVSVSGGLQNIDSLKELNIKENATLEAIKDYEESKRIARNKRARERRLEKRAYEQALANDAKRILRLV